MIFINDGSAARRGKRSRIRDDETLVAEGTSPRLEVEEAKGTRLGTNIAGRGCLDTMGVFR
jgi:hypothetical protein